MVLKIDNKKYPVIIIKKNNKNTYIRVSDNFEIIVTTNYLANYFTIKSLINKNIDLIKDMINKKETKIKKNNLFYYKGQQYDIVINSSIKNVEIINDKIITPNEIKLKKWFIEKSLNHFQSLLEETINKFEENIPLPALRVRKMKTRWGVCNRKNNTITLNLDLMQFNDDIIKYVIIHELAHFVHFDHSKNFWNLVSKYCPNYKELKKLMKY